MVTRRRRSGVPEGPSRILENPWDAHADAYARILIGRETTPEQSPLLARLLECLGNVDGCAVLDACCGEGFLSRILASRGAHVTGVDVSPRLIKLAKGQAAAQTI